MFLLPKMGQIIKLAFEKCRGSGTSKKWALWHPTLFLIICDLLSFLFCLLTMLGDGPSFHGCQVPHLPWQKTSRKGVKVQAKMTHLWTQVSKGDSSTWQQERSQYPMCGALLSRKEWGVWEQANWEQSPRVVILQEKTSCSTLTIAQPHLFTLYLKRTSDINCYDHQWLAST